MEKSTIEKFPCQLYTYNKDEYDLTLNSPDFFAENFKPQDIKDKKVAWLNFHSISCNKEIYQLLESLGVDVLVMDDIYKVKRRTKIEEYNSYMFFTLLSALPPDNSNHVLNREQISFILGENYLISLQQKSSDHFTEVRSRIEIPKGRIRSKGADFLLFRMLEAILDNYYEVVDEVIKKIDSLEKKVLESSHSLTLKVIEREKNKLSELKRIVLPMRDISWQILSSENTLFDKLNRPYFVNLRDLSLGVLEEIESAQQQMEGLTNLYYAVQGQKMNDIMKLLTIISTVFIPLTFLAGIYGMNFDNMPELHMKYGYFYLLGLMLFIAGMLYFYFKKKNWLKRN